MDEQIIIRMPSDKKEQLQKIAERRGLIFSSFVRMILYEQIDKDENRTAA